MGGYKNLTYLNCLFLERMENPILPPLLYKVQTSLKNSACYLGRSSDNFCVYFSPTKSKNFSLQVEQEIQRRNLMQGDFKSQSQELAKARMKEKQLAKVYFLYFYLILFILLIWWLFILEQMNFRDKKSVYPKIHSTCFQFWLLSLTIGKFQ